jgi:hypothetical protein
MLRLLLAWMELMASGLNNKKPSRRMPGGQIVRVG